MKCSCAIGHFKYTTYCNQNLHIIRGPGALLSTKQINRVCFPNFEGQNHTFGEKVLEMHSKLQRQNLFLNIFFINMVTEKTSYTIVTLTTSLVMLYKKYITLYDSDDVNILELLLILFVLTQI